jgi:membrane protease YdiL (CAAX protease family)
MADEPARPTGESCASCGTPYRGGARFCARCGTRIPTLDAEVEAELPPPVRPDVSLAVLEERSTNLRVVGWFYALLMLTSLGFGLFQHFEPERDIEPWITLVFGAVVLAFSASHFAEILALLGPSTLNGNALRKLAIAALVQFAALGLVFYLLEKTGIPFERITDEMQRHNYTLWELLLIWSLAPAFFEEIAFRGIIFGRLRAALGEREGWLVQAAFFSILHLNPVIFPTHFAIGLILGWLRMRSGSLLPGMILHAAWNAAVILNELDW